MSEAKKQVVEVFDKGNLIHIEQRLRVEYMRRCENVTPKVIIDVATTEQQDKTPRSFRTDNPEKLRKVIRGLISCLHQLEHDLKH